MKILAFDQATVLGYSILDGDIELSPPIIDLIEVDSVSFKKEKKQINRLLELEEWVFNKIKSVNPDVVVCENIHFRYGPKNFQTLSEILFIIKRACFILGYELYIYAPSEARSTFGLASKGNTKLDYVKWAKEFYGINEQITHDACDSLVLGTHHLYKMAEEECNEFN